MVVGNDTFIDYTNLYFVNAKRSIDFTEFLPNSNELFHYRVTDGTLFFVR